MPNPTPPTKRKLKTTTPAYQGETAEPTVKPTPIPSDAEMDKVVAENPSPAYQIPSIAPSSPGGGLVRGGTEAVAAYQRKLNSMGANLTVDGAWGDKTQAAFDQYQGKPTPKATIRKAPKEVVSGLPGGDIAIARAQETAAPAMVGGKTGVHDYTKMDFLTKNTPTVNRKRPTAAQVDAYDNELAHRDSAEIEAQNGDPEMPGSTHLNPAQAKKKVAIETRDGKTLLDGISRLSGGQIVGAAGTGIALGSLAMAGYMKRAQLGSAARKLVLSSALKKANLMSMVDGAKGMTKAVTTEMSHVPLIRRIPANTAMVRGKK